MKLYKLQLDGTKYNKSDPLKLDTNELQLDHPIAARREPIATRVTPVATERNLITIRVGAFSIHNAPMCIIAKHYIYIHIYTHTHIYTSWEYSILSLTRLSSLFPALFSLFVVVSSTGVAFSSIGGMFKYMSA
jgi:hypothetical protein